VLRSTWNYPHRVDDFVAWVESLSGRVLNPAPIVRWNVHKSYLLELGAAGLPVVPTALVARGSTATLAELLDQRGWQDAVLKPAVSAGSLETYRVHRAELARHEARFAALVGERDMLLQPYLRSVEGHGERAIVAIDGCITHAVRKSARFSADDEHVSPALPVSAEEQRLAEAALAHAERRAGTASLLYGRVDVARREDGSACIMELELVEPSLFLAQSPPALRALVAAIQRRIQ
jgi:glutathione synthase/RimK-type ligase-like ATP-grasp enzyme